MKLPNGDRAVIAPAKLRDYLLNISHRSGVSKARLLHSMGYTRRDWTRLEADLRSQHLTSDAVLDGADEYGVSYAIETSLTGPVGRPVVFRSIWQIDSGTDIPRLITMYPR